MNKFYLLNYSIGAILPGKNTGEDCHLILQGIFPTRRLNPHLIVSLALSGGVFTSGDTREAQVILKHLLTNKW